MNIPKQFNLDAEEEIVEKQLSMRGEDGEEEGTLIVTLLYS